MRRGLVLACLLGLVPGLAWAQATGVNPVPGSVWTYLGPTYGAAWGPPPGASNCQAGIGFGLVAGGATDNSVALQAALSSGPSNTICLAEGVYRVSCGKRFSANVSLMGAGPNTIIRQDPGCAETGNFIEWLNQPGIYVANLTIDLNGPASNSLGAGLAFYVNTGALRGPVLSGVSVINQKSPGFDVAVSVLNNAGNWIRPIITGGYFTFAAADTTQNQCIVTGGTGGGDSVSLGNISYMQIVNNVCINSGVQMDGAYGLFAGNDISGWAFGTGLFMMNNTPPVTLPSSDHDNIIAYNNFHDSPAGYDVNSTSAGGIENDCYRCTFISNTIARVGGEGIRNYGNYTVYTNNTIYDYGKTTSIIGNYYPAGINLVQAQHQPYGSEHIGLENNVTYDSGQNTSQYGYADNSGGPTSQIGGPVTMKGNIWGATVQAIKTNAPPGTINSDWTYIQNVTAAFGSGVAALTFSPIDVASYHHLKLECSDIVPTSASQVTLQLAEGGAFMGSPSYSTVVASWASDTPIASADVTTVGAMTLGTNNFADAAGTYPTSFTATTGDLSNTRGRKVWRIDGTGLNPNAGGGPQGFSEFGWWVADSGSINGLRVIAASGTITGSCTLWGRP